MVKSYLSAKTLLYVRRIIAFPKLAAGTPPFFCPSVSEPHNSRLFSNGSRIGPTAGISLVSNAICRFIEMGVGVMRSKADLRRM